MNSETLSNGLTWGLAFIFSATCHEAAHALVGKWGGDLTAYEGGQVTLNPIPHIRREPMGMLVIPIISFFLIGFMVGYASAPYNPHWAARYPKRAGLMALAGPVANLVLALFTLAAMHLIQATGFLADSPILLEIIVQLLWVMLLLNAILFVFNMVPLSPLDGALAAVLLFPSRHAKSVLEKTHALGMMGMLIAYLVMGKVIEPLVHFCHALFPRFLF